MSQVLALFLALAALGEFWVMELKVFNVCKSVGFHKKSTRHNLFFGVFTNVNKIIR